MRYHRGHDGWGRDSYAIPEFAVVGSSDCGTYADSPAPSDLVQAELELFREILRTHRIHSRIVFTRSGNAFMVKRWVVVAGKDYAQALPLATQFLREHQADTRYIHDAA